MADSPNKTASRATVATLTGSGIAHDDEDGGVIEINNERGLLGLILDTDEKEAIRRKNERLRSAERARRVFSSSPPERNRKDVDEFPKQQAPRQGTAEVAKVRIVRSKTMPTAENVSTGVVAVRAKRSSTPTTSRPGEGAAPPSPATKRDGSLFKTSSPTPATTAIPPPPTDPNRASGDGTAAPKTVYVRASKGSRDGTNKTPPIPRAASTEAMLIAPKLHGAGDARLFLSFDDASPRDSSRKRERRVSAPRDPKARAPSSTGTRAPAPSSGRGTRGKWDSSGSTPPGNPSLLTTKRVDDR